MLEISPIVEVAKAFKSCCDSLGRPITPYECESFGRFFTLSYGTENRAFHHLAHALEVSDGCSPAGRIAAFFHDVVYKQVDHAKFPDVNSLFGVFDPGNALEVTIPAIEVLNVDPWRMALAEVFAVKPGQILHPQNGMNEFLSAWTAIQKLSCVLTREQILHVIACIEATIPFRGDQHSPTVSEKLKIKVEAAAKILKLKMSTDEVEFIIHDSVKISNNDIKGFTESAEEFIHDSWALLYESNPALQSEFHSVSEYRVPLEKLEKFLHVLHPEQIFIRYQDTPSVEDLANFHLNAQKNLSLGRNYIRAKLLDATILEAFAKISGGDCPLNLFAELRPRIEDFLKHSVPKKHVHKKDQALRSLLGNERVFKSPFSVETFLFGTFIYDSLTEAQTETAHAAAALFFSDQATASDFLNSLPEDLVVTVGDTLSALVWTRAPVIQEFIHAKRGAKKVA